jgi:aminoglycoside 6'-N-acetyltransferase I
VQCRGLLRNRALLFKIREGIIISAKSIKTFNLESLEECIDLYIKVFNSAPWEENWSYEVAKERLDDLYHTPKFDGYTLYNNDRLVGFIVGNQKRTPQGIVFYIAELCINSEEQGQGYGSLLLESLEKKLKNIDVTSIYLLTSNGGLAESFYLKKNYAVNKNRIVMRKSL